MNLVANTEMVFPFRSTRGYAICEARQQLERLLRPRELTQYGCAQHRYPRIECTERCDTSSADCPRFEHSGSATRQCVVATTVGSSDSTNPSVRRATPRLVRKVLYTALRLVHSGESGTCDIVHTKGRLLYPEHSWWPLRHSN